EECGWLCSNDCRGAVLHRRRLLGAELPVPPCPGSREMTDMTASPTTEVTIRRGGFDLGGWLLTILTIICAAIWFFPLYWAGITTFKAEDEAVRPGFAPLPEALNLDSYAYIIQNSSMPIWYVNSTITSVAVTVIVVLVAACAGYAISQLR